VSGQEAIHLGARPAPEGVVHAVEAVPTTLTSRSFVVVWTSSGTFSLAAWVTGERRRYSSTASFAVLPMW
jgi:hypothetical protein